MKNKKIVGLILALVLLCCAGVGGWFYFNVDMTGAPYDEIAAYIEANPKKNVTYTVTIEGNAPVELNESSTMVTGLDMSCIGSLLTQAEYLQGLTEISFSDATMTAEQFHDLTDAFPHAEITCGKISFLGRDYDYHTTTVDLSDLTAQQVAEAAEGLTALPKLETVELCKGDQVSTVALADASALQALCPDVKYNYRIKLYGQTLSSDMERVEYFRKSIGDEGLDTFRQLIPLMHNLNYLKLDWCHTSDEEMAKLRDEFAPRVKIVWRVFFHEYNCLTDTLKIWGNWTVNYLNNHVLQYCTDVRYLDLGHTMITDCEWARNMPNLEVVIMGDCNLKSIEPLRDCPNITFLEIFSSKVTDLTPLEDLHNLKYLNISNLKIDDITPLYGLNNLVHVNSVMNTVPQEQVEEFARLHPECEAYFFSHGDPTKHNWRYDINGRILPRYALLREQIGYDTTDYSMYPTGYVTEEITYESTGIDPDPGPNYKYWPGAATKRENMVSADKR